MVADETARASYDMLENLIQRASQLSLSPQLPSGKSSNKTVGRGRYARSLSEARYQDSSSGECSDTSGALRTDEDLGSIGYNYEHSEHDVIVAPPHQASLSSCSRQDLESPHGCFNLDSPGGQTLVSLKQEAIQDRQQRPGNQHGWYSFQQQKAWSSQKGFPIM